MDIAHAELFFLLEQVSCFGINIIVFFMPFFWSTINNFFGILLSDQNKGKSRIYQHSGSMITAKGNVEQMLKEHEKNIQEAVRKARLSKHREL